MTNAVGRLADSLFKDLYISKSFADVKGLAGASDSRTAAPQCWESEIEALRRLCFESLERKGLPEFAVIQDKVVYRVTHLEGNETGGVFVLRRSEAQIRDPRGLGISRRAVDVVLDPKAVGLVLVVGAMGAGKTSTAASFVVERLKLHGGTALAIEDPTETNIDGVHGKGRCIAVSASRHNGGYREHLLRGLRSGVDFMFVGEIRDEDTAFEALKAGANGTLIIATLHGISEILALERLVTLASKHTSTAPELLADSLLAVIWQSLNDEPKQGGGTFKRLASSTLVIGEEDHGIREKIRRGEFAALEGEIQRQANQRSWQA